MELKDNPTLADIQSHLNAVCKESGWDKNSPTEVFLLFMEEVGELAKAIRKELGFKGEARPEKRDNLEEEFADSFNYFLELANRFEIDLESVYRKKQEINKSRVWN